MLYSNFVEPSHVEVVGREFVISKIPAFAAMPVFEEYMDVSKEKGLLARASLSEASVRTMLSHVATRNADGDMEVLDTTAKIETAFPDLSVMIGVVSKMVEYNFGFFDDGSLLGLLEIPEAAAEESGS